MIAPHIKSKRLINDSSFIIRGCNYLSYSKPIEISLIEYNWALGGSRSIYIYEGNIVSEENLETLDNNFRGFSKYIKDKGILYNSKGKYNYSDVYIIDSSRGPQSFAYGHFIIDVLPIIYLLKLNLKLLRYNYPVLIYKKLDWQVSLCSELGIDEKLIMGYESLKPCHGKTGNIGEFIQYNIESPIIRLNNRANTIKAMRKSYLLEFNKKYHKEIDLLILRRENIIGRSNRWINLEDLIYLLETTNIRYKVVDPLKIELKELILLIKSTRISITPPGSAAYNTLLFGDEDHFTIMPVSYNVHSKEIWKFTLRMFKGFRGNLIICSDENSPPPMKSVADSDGWDKEFKIMPESLIKLINSILKNELGLQKIEPKRDCQDNRKKRRKLSKVNGIDINYPSIDGDV